MAHLDNLERSLASYFACSSGHFHAEVQMRICRFDQLLQRPGIRAMEGAGLVYTISQPPCGMTAFKGLPVHTVRRFEQVRTTRDMDLATLNIIHGLIDEPDGPRSELRFPRNRSRNWRALIS